MSVPSERIPSLSEAIDRLMQRRLAEVHTVLPGRIVKYDKDTQLADVEVCVKHRTPTDDGDEIVEDFPVVPNVPVEHLQTAGFFASFPVAINDFVWLHIVEQSIDRWMDRGGVKVDDPIDRRFNLKDCFATLARNPKAPLAETENDAMVIGARGVDSPRAYFTDSLIALGAKTPSSFVALAQNLDTILSALYSVAISNCAAPGSPLVGAPALLSVYPSGFPSVAATKVKAV